MTVRTGIPSLWLTKTLSVWLVACSTACTLPYPATNPLSLLVALQDSAGSGTAAGSAAEQAPANTLVVQYTFNAGSLDDSGYLDLGLTSSGATLATGRSQDASGSYYFDGTASLFSAQDARLPLGNSARTLCAWIFPETIPSTPMIALSYGDSNESERAVGIGIVDNSGTISLIFGNPENGSDVDWPVAQRTWSHYCAVYSGGNDALLYYNGLLAGTAAFSQSRPLDTTAATQGVRIGALGTQLPWQGRIDEVRIYNYALSAADIRALHGNLLRNASAEKKDLSDWNIIANGGNGWEATNGIEFRTSWDWGRKEQTIDLVAAGYSAAYLDTSPRLCFGESIYQRPDVVGPEGVWRQLSVTLLDGGMGTIDSYATGDVEDLSITPDSSIDISGNFSSYPAGLRHVRFEHGGRDTLNWGGHFGAHLFGSYVYFCD